jgi:hypothetical protein
VIAQNIKSVEKFFLLFFRIWALIRPERSTAPSPKRYKLPEELGHSWKYPMESVALLRKPSLFPATLGKCYY